jgi:hypothetical protein
VAFIVIKNMRLLQNSEAYKHLSKKVVGKKIRFSIPGTDICYFGDVEKYSAGRSTKEISIKTEQGSKTLMLHDRVLMIIKFY